MERPPEKEKGQLTLFDLGKVVSSKATWGAFSESDLLAHRATLLDPASSKHLLLNTLRKLDCYRLGVEDLGRAELGRAVATLAARHPREEVAKLAGALMHKWRQQGDEQLYALIEGYDAAAAAAAPEGDPTEFKLQAPPPPPPEAPPQPTRVLPQRKGREQRYKEEEAYLDGDSDLEDAISSSSEEEEEGGQDEEWVPAGARRRVSAGGRGGGKGSPRKPLSPGSDPRQKKLCFFPRPQPPQQQQQQQQPQQQQQQQQQPQQQQQQQQAAA